MTALLLFLPLIRPFFKKLNALDGLDWLPLPAFLIVLALIPAYGFRPEALPLLICAALFTGINILRMTRGGERFGNSRRTRFILALPPLVLLAAAAGVAFYFTPEKDTDLIISGVPGVYTQNVSAGTPEKAGRSVEYLIKVYTAENPDQGPKRPLLVLLPPAAGSQAAVEQVSGELRDRGFTVLSYSRRGACSWLGLRYIRVFSSGTISSGANSRGRAMEEERKEDLLFLLSWIRQNPRIEGKTPLFDIASPDAVFLAGYDAAGSALILQANSFSSAGRTGANLFPPRAVSSGGINIRGLIAVESPLWSLYREETPDLSAPPRDTGGFKGWFQSARYGFNRWLWDIKPKKIAGLGQVPELSIPTLFLLSDRSREDKYRESKYLAPLKCFEAARGPAVLVSADGAGPLDYSDFPALYPLITALFPGRGKPVWTNPEAPGVSAEIMASFADGVLQAEGDISPLRNTILPAGLQIQKRNISF